MKSKQKEAFRNEIADKFLKCIEENPTSWIKPWTSNETGVPKNVYTNTSYTGINRLYLKWIENEQGYGDNRWLTFKQIQDKDYKLKSGSKGAKVEYFIPYDNENKKWSNWKEFDETATYIDENDREKPKYSVRAKYYTVFNGSCIEGLEKLENKVEYRDIFEMDVINNICKGMGVKIIEKDNFDRAYYEPITDSISIPNKKQFLSQEDYYTTACHELSHATGVSSRLNRKCFGDYGKDIEARAYEELVAEISSAFMGEYFNSTLSEDVMKNHEAYVSSWAKSIKSNKNYLFSAIKEASKSADYLVDAGDLNRLRTEELEFISESFDFNSKKNEVDVQEEEDFEF